MLAKTAGPAVGAAGRKGREIWWKPLHCQHTLLTAQRATPFAPRGASWDCLRACWRAFRAASCADCCAWREGESSASGTKRPCGWTR